MSAEQVRKPRTPPRLSVAVITQNEAANLPRALRALRSIADEIVVVDSGSTDDTVPIAHSFGARVFETDWLGYARQKQRAIDLCQGEWVFSIDADEVPDETLLAALSRLPRPDDCEYSAFQVDRLTEYQGRFVRYAWSPDWITRVVRRGAGRFNDSLVHEKIEVDGRLGRLPGHLLHYSYDDLDDQYRRLLGYARLGALELRRRGRRFHPHQLVTHPWLAFIQRLVFKRGILDGVRGLLIAGSTASYTFWKYAFLFELELADRLRNHDRPPDPDPAGATGASTEPAQQSGDSLDA